MCYAVGVCMQKTSSPINMVDVIRSKRDGHELSDAEIKTVVEGYTRGEIPDYQMSSLLMAIFLRGLSVQELHALTQSMLHSGKILDLSSLPGPKIGKHSTGGVGDKVSLTLAPAVAACGVYVPKMSGRGLGHTGGTLDKLEAIPGFSTQLDAAQFQKVLRSTGLALIGQSQELAPADKKIYALRDVTGTVESMPLIASSIMSKKLAEGNDGLVLDVKVGSGALMKTIPAARELAQALRAIGQQAGKHVSAFVTDMDQPLGRWVGNAAEVNEAVAVLRGHGPSDVRELTCVLGGEMLRLAGVVLHRTQGAELIANVLDNGKALDRFGACAKAQGARIDLTRDEHWFQTNLHQQSRVLYAPRAGWVGSMQAEFVGLAAVALGVGRKKKEDDVDPAAFVFLDKKCGEFVQAGEPLCHYAASPEAAASCWQEAEHWLEKVYALQEQAPNVQPLVVEEFL